jgi:hypothetical protein
VKVPVECLRWTVAYTRSVVRFCVLTEDRERGLRGGERECMYVRRTNALNFLFYIINLLRFACCDYCKVTWKMPFYIRAYISGVQSAGWLDIHLTVGTSCERDEPLAEKIAAARHQVLGSLISLHNEHRLFIHKHPLSLSFVIYFLTFS